MNNIDDVEQIVVAENLTQELRLSLIQANYWFCPGTRLQTMPFYEKGAWTAFADCWNQLALDKYMGDSGIYRYRRYGIFLYHASDARLEIQAHSPYSQPSYVNQLNGGIERHFEPLEMKFINNSFLQGLLIWCAKTFNLSSSFAGDWDIKLHPYRILAMESEMGYPTPEGLHRDGVDYILTLMVQRHNIAGGETTITNELGKSLWQQALLEPLDIVIADDARTKHAVSPIKRFNPTQDGHRDVLVAAFTRN